MFTFGDLAEGLRSGYPYDNDDPSPHSSLMAFLLLYQLSPASESAQAPKASVSKVKRPKSWDKLVSYVMANGAERGIKAPLSTNLGFREESVPSKAFRYKQGTAPDGREHAIHAVYSESNGKKKIVDIALSNSLITETDGRKHVDGYMFRLKPNGTPVSALRIKGDVGDVVQSPMAIESKEARDAIKSEKKLMTETMANKDFE